MTERKLRSQGTTSTSSAGSANAATIKMGPYRDTIEVYYDITTASDDIVTEVSSDGSSWRTKATTATGGQTTGGAFLTTETTTYEYVRVYGASGFADSEINTIELSVK